MKTILLATALILALIFGYAAARSVAEETTSKVGETSGVSLVGKAVKNPQGEHLGTIADVATGPGGNVAFAVLSYEVSDDTQMRVAVPFGALSCEGKTCFLNASREALNSAPVLVLEDDLVGPKLAEDIYRYFGLQPYWTE